MEKIAFFHMNQLGDLMFSLPLLQAVRRERPDAVLCSIIRPDLAPLLEASGLVNGVILKRKGGFQERLHLAALLRAERFSRAVLFSESPDSILMATLAGIPERCGFATASLAFLLTARAGRTGVPSLANNRSLAVACGLNTLADDYTVLLRVPQDRIDAINAWLVREHIDASRLVVLSPGASKRRLDKCWPEDHWIALARRLQEAKFIPVLCGAPSEKTGLERIARRVDPCPRVFAAPDGILSFAALLSRARLFVGIDSGAMHLAAGIGVPVIAIFGKTDPAQIGPRPLERHTVLKNETIETILPDTVLAAVRSRIGA